MIGDTHGLYIPLKFEMYTEQMVSCFMIDIADVICNHSFSSIAFQIDGIFSPRDIEITYHDVQKGIIWRLYIMVTPSRSYAVASILCWHHTGIPRQHG